MHTVPKCPICLNDCARYHACNTPKCFAKTCGNKDCRKKLTQKTNLEKYGVTCNLHEKLSNGHTVQQDIFMKKYGVNNAANITGAKQKRQDTCFKNFGVKWPMQSSSVREKSKNILLERYGVDNISKTEYFKEKFVKHLHTITENGRTNLQNRIELRIQRFKNDNDGLSLFQTEEFKNNTKLFMLEKHGVDNYFKTKEFDELMKERGVRYYPEQLLAKELYYSKVMYFTRKNYLIYKPELELEYKRSKSYHLDHIFSIVDGFINDVDPEIIGSIVNLQILPAKVNLTKNSSSWITLSDLLEAYQRSSKSE